MNYHTQHAPMGAFASFTVGLPGARGGLGQSLPGPAEQNVYAGFRRASSSGEAEGESWTLLPFHQANAVAAMAAFLGEAAAHDAPPAAVPHTLDAAQIERRLGWASDAWRAGVFSFRVLSPFAVTGEPDGLDLEAERLAFAPLVTAEVGFDNRSGTDAVELVFGLGNAASPFRPLEDVALDLTGFALGAGMGFAAKPEDVSARVQGFSIFDSRSVKDQRGLHLLGGEAALVFRVEAGAVRRFPITLAFYQAGDVTTGLITQFYYTRLFESLEEVLRHGLREQAHYVALAEKRDAELNAAVHLNDDQRWLIAQATHSYFGSSQLLWDVAAGRPLWNVNEGEYRMINTFDLTVDHLFFELTWHPWAVRNALDLFSSRYSFRDGLKVRGEVVEGGVSFTHDMGVVNHFTPAGTSSYECTGINGCFSQMTAEQLLNWICCAGTYAESTGDRAWLRENQALLTACAESLRRRDDPEAARRTGLLKWDSARCGEAGAEITTYDSLDVSLGQARNNLYIAVKAFAAWTLLERVFGADGLGLTDEANAAREGADLAAAAIAARFDEAVGMFPAVFEGGNRSRILPAVEGLVFPLFLGFVDELRGRYPDLFAKLGEHLRHALCSGVCLDAKTGAWKVSSTSANTWFSKIALSQHVSRQVFPDSLGREALHADRVHATMQQAAPLGRFAMVDQVHAQTGEPLGSRYYPRVVTACLWLRER
jgi:xylan 1,4-beta-xylosidase